MNVKYLLVLGAALASVTPALASGPEYLNLESNWNCGNQKLSFDVQLQQCNKAIAEAQINGGKVPVDLMEARGVVYLQKGDYDNAIADLERVIGFKPDYPAYMDRGIARRHKNQCDLAVQDFTQALTLEKDSALAFDLRGKCDRDLGQYQNAIQDLDRAIALKTTDPFAYLYRGSARSELGQYDLAIDDYNQAIRLEPDSGEYYGLAVVYQHQRQYAKAIENISKAIAINPNVANYFNARCWNRALANVEIDTALDDCNHALAMDPKDEGTLDSRALAYFRKGDFKKAIADASAALAIDPKMNGSLYVRGLAKLKTGDTSGGNADIASAKAIDPKIADTYAGYGVTP